MAEIDSVENIAEKKVPVNEFRPSSRVIASRAKQSGLSSARVIASRAKQSGLSSSRVIARERSNPVCPPSRVIASGAKQSGLTIFP